MQTNAVWPTRGVRADVVSRDVSLICAEPVGQTGVGFQVLTQLQLGTAFNCNLAPYQHVKVGQLSMRMLW